METTNNPLVSIIVITYNSGKYVLETLESAKAQTYQNIELIVSDDYSTDNTVEICRKWIDENKECFVRTELVTSPLNTGIPANCNRGVRAARGEWIKLIAGDDLLLPNCAIDNIEFSKTTDTKIFFSVRVSFKDVAGKRIILQKSIPSIFNSKIISAHDQYQLALRRLGCPPNTLFINKKVLDELNGYDENFPFIEDWPFLVKITKAGYKLEYFPRESVMYRIHSESIFHTNIKDEIYTNYTEHVHYPMYRKVILPNIPLVEKLAFYYKYLVVLVYRKTILNRRNVFTRIINKLLLLPYYFANSYFRKRISKKILKKYN